MEIGSSVVGGVWARPDRPRRGLSGLSSGKSVDGAVRVQAGVNRVTLRIENEKMCGRFTLRTPVPRLIEIFDAGGFPELSPRYNIAPTQMVACLRGSESRGEAMQASLMRWGLVPFWAKDVSIGSRMINSRSETAATKPSFRRAWKSQRCVIPADGFFEWEKLGGKRKQAWLIEKSDAEPFCFAGLWEVWSSGRIESRVGESEGGNSEHTLLSCTILTTEANADIQRIHERMPVILNAEQAAIWVSPECSAGQRDALVRPLPPGDLRLTAVSEFVNKPINDGPECIRPASPRLFD